jgi:rare lipoprotein A
LDHFLRGGHTEHLRSIWLTCRACDEILNSRFFRDSVATTSQNASQIEDLMQLSRIFALSLVAAALAGSFGMASAQTSPSPATPVVAPPAPAVAPAAAPVAPAAVKAATSVESGKIAWYGKKFAGRRTASGEAYNPDAMTMAHKTLPFGTRVKVTNLANQKSVTLRVNDRGPTQADRIGDVSLAAARQLGMVRTGVTDAELEVVAEAPAKKR